MVNIVLGLTAIAIAVLFYLRKKTNAIKCTYSCDEGNFRISGKKNCFYIRKGNRFVFTVIDGQIVSVVDKAVTGHAVKYGRATDGNK